MRNRLFSFLFSGIFTAVLLAPLAAQAELTSMRGPLFGNADEARARAEATDAELLAPLSYGEALENYSRANATFKRAGSVESIRRYLVKAETKFNKSAQAAEIAATALDAIIQARKDALASDAPTYATDSWDEGEQNFAEATRRLERGSIKYAQRYGDKAQNAYREGELTSIKANYLNETKNLIRVAEKLRAERYAPSSITNARVLLESAETELNANRYDTDRPRSLAADAKHNALHAIYVSKLEKRIRAGETSLEAILLNWESSISMIGAALDQPTYFDHGQNQAVNELLTSVAELQRGRTLAEQDMSDRDSQVATLNAQLAKMQELLGGDDQTIEELEELLEKQARHRERFASIESLFDPAQATVLRQGDTIIIRMIGLNFDSGAANLKSEHLNMLTTLKEAITIFPESQVIVEGHTDAFGSDAQNLDLSQSRAESVVPHLLISLPVSPANLRSVGYGESRPVANNETAAGRKRNRRIDVVIQPSWVVAKQFAQIQIPSLRTSPDR